MTSLRSLGLLALSAVVILGRITDQTTGQPLAGVSVRAGGANGASPAAKTNAEGRYRLIGVRPGPTTLTISSNDVPPQRFHVTLGAAASRTVDLTACSTTLDYSCAGPPEPGTNGPGGGS